MTQFSTREVPWMKLGKLEDEPVTAAEAVKLGGLDFQVEKRKLFYEYTTPQFAGQSTTQREIESRCAVVRTDTQEWLGIMSAGYPILQFSEAFDFIESAGTKFVAAGVLKGGRQGFMVVEAEGALTDLGIGDEHKMYAILRTSHDGTRAVEVSVMPLRQKCMNQLTLNTFSKDAPKRWAIQHSGNMAVKMAQLKETLVNLKNYEDAFTQIAQRLAKAKPTPTQARTIVGRIIPDTKKSKDETVETIINLWNSNTETVGFNYTGWALVNAVSEYYDWHRSGGTPESRFTAALAGQTERAVNKAAMLTLRLTNA